VSSILMTLAEAYARLKRPAEGLNCVSEASAIIAATDERYWESELYRLRGDLLTETGDQSAAEQSHLQAITVVKRQSAKLFELRAGTSLASFWRGQGRVAEARDVLAPVYNWFTEGFDAPILKEARRCWTSLRHEPAGQRAQRLTGATARLQPSRPRTSECAFTGPVSATMPPISR
jgi:predicted ATPase